MKDSALDYSKVLTYQIFTENSSTQLLMTWSWTFSETYWIFRCLILWVDLVTLTDPKTSKMRTNYHIPNSFNVSYIKSNKKLKLEGQSEQFFFATSFNALSPLSYQEKAWNVSLISGCIFHNWLDNPLMFYSFAFCLYTLFSCICNFVFLSFKHFSWKVEFDMWM